MSNLHLYAGAGVQVNAAFSPRTPAKTASILKGAKSPRSSQRQIAPQPVPSTKPPSAAAVPVAAPATSGSQTERRYDQVCQGNLQSWVSRCMSTTGKESRTSENIAAKICVRLHTDQIKAFWILNSALNQHRVSTKLALDNQYSGFGAFSKRGMGMVRLRSEIRCGGCARSGRMRAFPCSPNQPRGARKTIAQPIHMRRCLPAAASASASV